MPQEGEEGEHEAQASPCPEGAVGAVRRSSLQDEIWHEAGRRQQAAGAAEPAELHMRPGLRTGLFGKHLERRQAERRHAWGGLVGSS